MRTYFGAKTLLETLLGPASNLSPGEVRVLHAAGDPRRGAERAAHLAGEEDGPAAALATVTQDWGSPEWETEPEERDLSRCKVGKSTSLPTYLPPEVAKNNTSRKTTLPHTLFQCSWTVTQIEESEQRTGYGWRLLNLQNRHEIRICKTGRKLKGVVVRGTWLS